MMDSQIRFSRDEQVLGCRVVVRKYLITNVLILPKVEYVQNIVDFC